MPAAIAINCLSGLDIACGTGHRHVARTISMEARLRPAQGPRFRSQLLWGPPAGPCVWLAWRCGMLLLHLCLLDLLDHGYVLKVKMGGLQH